MNLYGFKPIDLQTFILGAQGEISWVDSLHSYLGMEEKQHFESHLKFIS